MFRAGIVAMAGGGGDAKVCIMTAMGRALRAFVLALIVVVATTACSRPQHVVIEPAAPPRERAVSRNVVVWISIDGLRGDYVDRGVTPFLQTLKLEGAYSQRLVPITPSLTFPSHVTEATGTPASKHGIPSNVFYDAASRQEYKMPTAASLLQAEPIWITAQRQGVRTLVHDWPLSYQQPGPVRTDYANETFDGKPSDEQRLTHLFDTWRNDPVTDKPLRLLMGYVKEPDVKGHKFGPDSPQINDALHATDAILEKFVADAVEQFNATRTGDEQLYVVLSTDHGMAPVKTLVNLRALFATPPPEQVRIITSGPLAMVYLDQVPPHERAELTKQMLTQLRRYELLSAYAHDTLPKAWRLDHPSRVGDITVMLEPGYTFSSKHPEAVHAQVAGEEPQGMHGFPPDKSSDMRGFLVIWRYPKPLGGRNLGTVHTEQLHPTVARVLGIHPSEDAKAAPVLER